MTDQFRTSTELSTSYRVIGLRADGSRAVVRRGISLQEANVVQDVIQQAQISADVQIEPEFTTSVPLS